MAVAATKGGGREAGAGWKPGVVHRGVPLLQDLLLVDEGE